MATLKASSDLQLLIKKIVLDIYFPVGSIYLSVNKTNPGSTFGGTWELVTNDSYLHCYNPNNLPKYMIQNILSHIYMQESRWITSNLWSTKQGGERRLISYSSLPLGSWCYL